VYYHHLWLRVDLGNPPSPVLSMEHDPSAKMTPPI
jgi:hypothetical protein